MATINQQFQSVLNSQQSVGGYAMVTTGQTMSMEAVYRMDLVSQPTQNYLVERTDWQDIEVRQAYMESCVEQDIAWQINLNRKKRELTQKQLAEKVGTTQTAIARWEDPCYGRHSIPSLVKIAHTLDCALIVRLAPYSELAELSQNTSKESFLVASYEQEIGNEK